MSDPLPQSDQQGERPVAQGAGHASGSGTFDAVPRTPAGHFVLFLYAAIFRLVDHVRRLAEAGGAPLEQVFERYPFLGEYFAEMRGHMPDELTWADGTTWWREEIAAWEDAASEPLPLGELGRRSGLGFASRLAFLAAGLVEEDSRFGTLLAELQEPLGHRRPTLELLGQMISGGGSPGGPDAWSVCRPLLDAGLLEVPNREDPRAEWVLRVPPLVWDAARGELPLRPAPWCRLRPLADLPRLEELLAPPEILERLARLPPLLETGEVRTVVLRSPPGGEPLEVMGAVARALGRSLLSADGQDPEERPDPETLGLLGPLAILGRALPVVSFDLGPGETAASPFPAGAYTGPLGLILGMEGGLAEEVGEAALTITLPPPRAALRERCWRRALDGRPVEDLPAIVERFHLGDGHIRRAARIATAQAALDGREAVRPDDVQQAARALNRQMLDTLAAHLPSCGSWQDLVLSERTRAKLDDLERRCRHRERILDHLGPAFGTGTNRGVRALFSGASGTGKTLAARVLAAELGMDLYRVDLAAIVNKYIGETEKNLHRVLSRAEALDVVLLLDEGDALLGNRTEVRSANDRYANLETDYLLQRLETYDGIVLVTTNLGENIDSAFQRRMDVVVPFFAPQAEERYRILDLHLPTDHEVTHEELERLAVACALTGGQIRNAALHAALLAVEDGGPPVAGWHLEEAVKNEYRKAGAAYPLTESRRPEHGGVEAFMSALGSHGR